MGIHEGEALGIAGRGGKGGFPGMSNPFAPPILETKKSPAPSEEGTGDFLSFS